MGYIMRTSETCVCHMWIKDHIQHVRGGLDTQVLDAERIDEELTQTWLRIAHTPVIDPITNNMKTRGSMLPLQLPTLIEDEEFSPLLDPLIQAKSTPSNNTVTGGVVQQDERYVEE